MSGQRKKIALIGDSYAEGLIPEFRRLCEQHADRCQADAIRGSGSHYWTTERVKDVTNGSTVVLISLGGNDFAKAAGSVDADARRIADQIRAQGARPLWVPPLRLPFPDKAGARKAWAMAVPDFAPWDVIFDPPRASDGVHLSPADYAKWMRLIWGWMDETLEHSQPKPWGNAWPSWIGAALVFGVVAAGTKRDRTR